MNTKSLHTLEYDKILNILTGFAYSDAAKAMASGLTPLTDIDQIELALDETSDALSRMAVKGPVSFSGATDIGPSIKRLNAGLALNSQELLTIASILSLASHVKNYYEDNSDSLTLYFNSLDPIDSVRSEINRCIISENEFADDASPKLRAIRRSLKQSKDRVHTEMTRILNSPSSRTYLQDTVITMRQGRYCLPVKAEYKSMFPGMVHDQSSSGSTLFIEPESVVRLNNDIRELELQEAAEIEVILANLSQMAASYTGTLTTDYETLVKLDFIFAKARLSEKFKATRPIMNDRNYINIKKGRHPLIPADRIVPTDIYIGDKFNLLIVTGPNTGGKTVSLKTTGLLTLMAASGLNIPAAQSSEIAVFDNIYADIGDEQSIEQNLSTFSSHMTNTVNILKEADSKSLILFDEIGAGTDPIEGAALATSILNKLHVNGITTMATTHYSELKVYALDTEGVENACCEFDVATLKPTYRLLIGIPGKSNAFAISKKLGLTSDIIDDASARIDSSDIHFEDLISDLEASRVTIAKEQEEIKAYKREINALKAEFNSKNKRLDERTDKIIRKANEEAAEILRQAKEYADTTIKTMNKHGLSIQELEKSRTAVREKLNTTNKRNSKPAAKPETVNPHKSHKLTDFYDGCHVRVISMNLNGIVSGKPNTKGEVTVSIGSMNTKTKITNLEILDNYKEPKEETKGAFGSTFGGKRSGSGSSAIRMDKTSSIKPEINLLGNTVDEACAKLDKYLDDAYISGISEVRVVHGKGTGALRGGIHTFLKSVSYVKSFRLGKPGEGDAGVTIVELKK